MLKVSYMGDILRPNLLQFNGTHILASVRVPGHNPQGEEMFLECEADADGNPVGEWAQLSPRGILEGSTSLAMYTHELLAYGMEGGFI
jgi:hypothetical protein